MSKSVLCFPQEFIVSVLIFRSVNNFEFISIYGRECSNFIVLHVAVHFPQHHLLKRPTFLHCMLLLLSPFSHVQLCATPYMAAYQALPSLGFSRQEHWSGLPFPPPMHESEKWKGSHSVVSNSSRPHGLQPTRLLRPWDFPGKSTGVGCHRLLHSIFLPILP